MFRRYFKKSTYLLHKWLGLIVGLQMLAWIFGGMLFVLIPFQPIIKGGDYFSAVKIDFNNYNIMSIGTVVNKYPKATSIMLSNIGDTPVYKVLVDNKYIFIDAVRGSVINKPTQNSIINHANAMYTGGGNIVSVKYIDENNADELKSFLIVDELGGKTNIWQVEYDDFVGSRLYFLDTTGEFYKYRNNAWVVYDFFWRLHVMDYKEGEYFNGTLIRIVSVLSFILTLTGLIMLFYARFLKPKNRISVKK